jgi:hypothetical protein
MAEMYWWRMGGKSPEKPGEMQAVQGEDPRSYEVELLISCQRQ